MFPPVFKLTPNAFAKARPSVSPTITSWTRWIESVLGREPTVVGSVDAHETWVQMVTNAGQFVVVFKLVHALQHTIATNNRFRKGYFDEVTGDTAIYLAKHIASELHKVPQFFLALYLHQPDAFALWTYLNTTLPNERFEHIFYGISNADLEVLHSVLQARVHAAAVTPK